MSRKQILIITAILLWLPILGILGHSYLWLPTKYRYLIRRVETAQTAEQEQSAFKLAADWGRVWEVSRLQSNAEAPDGRHLSGNWLLRLEWLDSSPFGGGAYCAYRAVIDTNNLKILYEKKY
jgi:hypothetical protein